MLNLKILIRILQPEFTNKLLYSLLALALVPIIDCGIIIFLAQLLGPFLFLAIIVFLSLTGFLFSCRLTFKAQEKIKNDLKKQCFLTETL